MGALDQAGGQAFLLRCAKNEKSLPAFLALVGKVLPKDINANVQFSGLAEALRRIRERTANGG